MKLGDVVKPEVWEKFQTKPNAKLVIGIGLPLVFSAVQLLLWPLLRPTYFLLSFPAVLIVSLLCGFRTAVGSAFLCAVISNFLFMPPEFSFYMDRSGATQIIIFLLNCMVMAWITSYLSKQYRQLIAIRLEMTNKKLEETIIELRRSNSELSQFAHVASHDMKEPLRMISSYVQMLEKRYGDKLDADAKQIIGYAVKGAKRLNTLLNDILAHSKVQMEPAELRKRPLGECLGQALENIRSLIDETGAVITSDVLPEAPCDHNLIVRVFQNLLINAIKFRKDNENAIVHVASQKRGHDWLISVKDNGIGIPDEDKVRVFDLFARGHSQEDYAGSGIGLATCRKIVEQMGGKIWVESVVGVGSTFYFTLPEG